jgi:hypothetical protein
MDKHSGKRRKCIISDCTNYALYNKKGCRSKKFCELHKTEDMVTIYGIRCAFKDCNKEGSYRFKNGIKGIQYCYIHKEEGMISQLHKICCITDCNNISYYNKPEFNKPKFCPIHKTDDMVFIHAKTCIINKCVKRAYFSINWDTQPKYCINHKSDNMINRRFPKCKNEECIKEAVYCYKKSSFFMYCNKHKKDDMIYYSLRNTICTYGKCFNKKYKKSHFCIQHCNFSHNLIKKDKTTKSDKVNYEILNALFDDE